MAHLIHRVCRAPACVALEQATAEAQIVTNRLLLTDQPAANQLTELTAEDFIDCPYFIETVTQRHIADIDICFDPGVCATNSFNVICPGQSVQFSDFAAARWQDPSGIRRPNTCLIRRDIGERDNQRSRKTLSPIWP